MVVICAWCRCVIDAGEPGEKVSHGICIRCAEDQLALFDRQRIHTRTVPASPVEWGQVPVLYLEYGGEAGGA